MRALAPGAHGRERRCRVVDNELQPSGVEQRQRGIGDETDDLEYDIACGVEACHLEEIFFLFLHFC